MKKPNDWKDYFDRTRDKAPSPLLLRALPYIRLRGRALDLGGGALRNARMLAKQGFDVTVVDKEPMVIDEAARVNDSRIHTVISPFDQYNFPYRQFAFVSALMSLPFNPASTFDAVFEGVKNSMQPDGVLCCHFFGERDSWNKKGSGMTFHTSDQVVALSEGLKPLEFVEQEFKSTTVRGAPKHLHVFALIAYKI
ncbi:MAG: tellurite methyltransferase [Patescibacteria group bacterium]|nr:tellurite methyltransferase [Patescibacteria group bacterium]